MTQSLLCTEMLLLKISNLDSKTKETTSTFVSMLTLRGRCKEGREESSTSEKSGWEAEFVFVFESDSLICHHSAEKFICQKGP